MMALPYFPLYPTDFEADAAHLTLEEDGAYNRLLRLCWMTPGCSIPADDEWIIRRLRITRSEFDRVVSPVLREFFRRNRGRFYNKRLREEWRRADKTWRAKSNAGKKGGRPQASEKQGNDTKGSKSNQNQNQNHNITPLTPRSGGNRKVGVSDNVKRLLREMD